MDNNLTPKAQYELKRQERQGAKPSTGSSKKAWSRGFLWLAVIVVIGGSVWLVANNDSNVDDNDAPVIDDGGALVVKEDDNTKGNLASGVVLIEYSDFQCPACAAYHPLLDVLATDMADDFVFVYRHFPLRQHANAKLAAQ